jgi:ribonucleoside-diphosphate reductase alpha chain
MHNLSPNDVTGSVLTVSSSKEAKQIEDDSADVIYMSEPLDRPNELEGSTYKLKWPDSEHAIYVTVNDVIANSARRPFEVFINSKNMEHFALDSRINTNDFSCFPKRRRCLICG